MKQKLFKNISSLKKICRIHHVKKIFLVAFDNVFDNDFVRNGFRDLAIPYTNFSQFTPNPKIEEAEKGLEIFKNGDFDLLVAIGGGSSLDVAKYIKQFTDVPFVAIPTTAGSGSEATKYAVIYKDGEKQSLSLEKIIPQYVVIVSSFLKTLPQFQKKCTLLDALCHSIESYWSVNSNAKSKRLSKKAISIILKNYLAYVNGDEKVFNKIMLASNLAGRAINITQTTAGHALSYKITTLFGLPHGYCVALCVREVWLYMNENLNLCTDKRGEEYLRKTLKNLSSIISLADFNNVLTNLEIVVPNLEDKKQITALTNAVNIQRLGNFPVKLEKHEIKYIYNRMFGLK